MRPLLFCAFFFAICLPASHAKPLSDETLSQLLEITEAKKLIEGIYAQVDQMLVTEMKQATRNASLTAEQQKLLDNMRVAASELFRSELSWEKLEPMYARIYKKALTEEEVAGMIEFYKTPAGAAVLKKLPLLMQEIMVEMRTVMDPLTQKVQALVEKTLREAKTAQPK